MASFLKKLFPSKNRKSSLCFYATDNFASETPHHHQPRRSSDFGIYLDKRAVTEFQSCITPDFPQPSTGETATNVIVNHNIPEHLKRTKWRARDFRIIKHISHTSYSSVGIYQCLKSNTIVVLKIYHDLGEFRRRCVEREVDIHISLDHTNIVKLYATFVDLNKVYLVMEGHGINIREYIKSKYRVRFPEDFVRKAIVPPLVNALQYLNRYGIIHRDIKPENILVDDTNGVFTVKLCDFSLAIDMNTENAVTQCGTVAYMAPEVYKCPLKQKNDDNKNNPLFKYDQKVDVWSLGILVYELMVGMKPLVLPTNFCQRDHAEQYPLMPKYLTPESVDFLYACMNRDPVLRASINQIAHCDWLTKA